MIEKLEVCSLVIMKPCVQHQPPSTTRSVLQHYAPHRVNDILEIVNLHCVNPVHIFGLLQKLNHSISRHAAIIIVILSSNESV